MAAKNPANFSQYAKHSLGQLSDIINDKDTPPKVKCEIMNYIEACPNEIFVDMSKIGFQFEKLIDSLIFHILKYSNIVNEQAEG